MTTGWCGADPLRWTTTRWTLPSNEAVVENPGCRFTSLVQGLDLRRLCWLA